MNIRHFNTFRNEILGNYAAEKERLTTTNGAAQLPGAESLEQRLKDQVVNILARLDCQSVKTAVNLTAPLPAAN